MSFSECIRTLRLERKWDQRELARRTGLGINTISSHETGKTSPSHALQESYAKAFGFLNAEEMTAECSPDKLNHRGTNGRRLALDFASLAEPQNAQLLRDIAERITPAAAATIAHALIERLTRS